MTVDGVWTGEIYSPYGWENSGVYVLDRGMIVGGNNRHYSSGSYEIVDHAYKAQSTVHYYGPPRAIFGERKEEFTIDVSGTVKDDVIEAQVVRSDKPDFSVQFRMTRRMDLPKH